MLTLAQVRASNIVDARWYSSQYPDVNSLKLDPIEHFHKHGYRLGRAPQKGMDFTKYLQTNPDVRTSGMDPLYHYVNYGKSERRSFSTAYLDWSDPFNLKLGDPAITRGVLSAQLQSGPRISIVKPIFNTPLLLLRDVILSV